jgi:signal transduction histidine kinase
MRFPFVIWSPQMIGSISITFSVVSAFICSLPFILGYHYHEPDRHALERSINSEYHIDSLLVSIVACLAISFDGLLDYLFGSLHLAKTSLPIRWLLLSSLIVPNAVMFFFFKVTFPHHMSPELFSTMTNVREILLQCSLINFLLSSSTKRGKYLTRSLVTQFALALEMILFQYGNFMSLSPYLLYLAFLSALLSLGLILWMLLSQFLLLVRTNQQKDGDMESMIYTLSLGFNIVGKYLSYVVSSLTVNMSSGYQSAIYNCIDIVTMLIIVSVHGRKSREEALLFQVSSCPYLHPPTSLSPSSHHIQNELAKKKTFVKYISHEIRTPLNIISLGIKYIVDHIEALNKDELREAMMDIQESSDVAICTLNNILTFETLDTGELTLIIKETCPTQFIRSTVKMFKLQASHARVDLRFEDSEYLSPSLNSIVAMIDTNKMSQVIRNLVSNALKFTKPGGTVTVRAEHKLLNSHAILEEQASTSSPHRRRTLSNPLALLSEFASPGTVFPEDGLQHYLIIEVEDDGIGMSEVHEGLFCTHSFALQENCEKLFTRAIQFDSIDVQNGNGSGLGLMSASLSFSLVSS